MRTASEAASRGRQAFGRSEIFIMLSPVDCSRRNRISPRCARTTPKRGIARETRSKTQPYLGVAKTLEDTTSHETQVSRRVAGNRWLTVRVLRSHVGSDTATLSQFVCTATIGRLQRHLQAFHVVEQFLCTLTFPPGIGAAALASAKDRPCTQETRIIDPENP